MSDEQSQTAAPESEAGAPTELGLDDALAYAIRLHRLGEADAALTLYQRILDAVPDHPDALNFLGIAKHQRGEAAEAIALMQRSLAIAPEAANVWNNLGNMLVDAGRFDEAGAAYERCAALNPGEPQLYNNLGVLRRSQQRPQDAEAAYLKALELDPKLAETHSNLANLYGSTGRIEDAVRHYFEAIVLMPYNPSARRMLGLAYYSLGRVEDAAAVYREWLLQEPDSQAARHHLAACTGVDVPARASDIYVESTFDGFASSFEVKLAALTYRAPELIAQTLAALYGEPAARLSALDAGCGTGLCGALVKPWTAWIEGVDLSTGMLTLAKAKDVYRGLFRCELTEFLEAYRERWDVVLSADTLCYFGELDAVCRAAFAALKPGGHLIFTVESLAEGAAGPWLLQPHGRYAHAAAYVAETLAACGFADVRLTAADLRTEGGKPVRGSIAVARKPE
ncbi:tetratricopeptide repeat protein [soil metagenome]